MDVRVIDERMTAEPSEPDFIRVRVLRRDAKDALAVTTIERVVRRSIVKPSTPPRRVKTLIERQPMTLDAALGFATLYARSKNIKLVLTAQDG